MLQYHSEMELHHHAFSLYHLLVHSHNSSLLVAEAAPASLGQQMVYEIQQLRALYLSYLLHCSYPHNQ